MEVKYLQSVFIYSIEDRNKIIGKLGNISIKESLKNIRPKVKKMTKNDVFVKLKSIDNYDIFDKDMEEEFLLEDVLIKEDWVYKIYIKESNDKNNNICNNDITDIKIPINNINNFQDNINQMNDLNIQMNQLNINPQINDMNAINNMNNMNNINDMNNINKWNNMNNNMNNTMNIANNMNNMNIMNNMNNINNMNIMNIMNNKNNMNNINSMNIMNNINNVNFMNNLNNFNNIGNMNIINNINIEKGNIKDSEQMNDNFKIKYNINFKTNKGIYSISANGRKNLYEILIRFKMDMDIDIFGHLKYQYNGQYIDFSYNPFNLDKREDYITLSIFFKSNTNPVIFVEDVYNLIGKIIHITFKVSNGDEFVFSCNGNKKLEDIIYRIKNRLDLISFNNIKFIYQKKEIKFDSKKIGELFYNDDNPIIFVSDTNNIISKKNVFKITFQTNYEYKKEIRANGEQVINFLLEQFLYEIDEQLAKIYLLIEGIKLLYRGQEISKYDVFITIEKFFKNDKNPIISVNDLNYLFLINWNAKKHIIFKTNYGHINDFIVKNIYFFPELMSLYFKIIGQEILVSSKKIQLLYSGKKIKHKSFTTIGQCFPKESEVIIFVNDPYNLFLMDWNQNKRITFQVNNSYKMELDFILRETFSSCVESFFNKIDQTDLINSNNNNIQYFYNPQQIQLEANHLNNNNNQNIFPNYNALIKVDYSKYDNNPPMGELFLNDNNPIIYIRDVNNSIKPFNITFKTGNGNTFKIFINLKKKVEHLLIKFLDEIHHPEFIDRNDKIQFLYRAQQIPFGDKTTLRDYFKNDNNPVIVVLDINNYLYNNKLRKKNFIFENPNGTKIPVLVNYGTTVEQLIKIYFYRVCGIEPIENYYYEWNNERIYFLYNSSKINFREQALIEKYFNSDIVNVKVFEK